MIYKYIRWNKTIEVLFTISLDENVFTDKSAILPLFAIIAWFDSTPSHHKEQITITQLFQIDLSVYRFQSNLKINSDTPNLEKLLEQTKGLNIISQLTKNIHIIYMYIYKRMKKKSKHLCFCNLVLFINTFSVLIQVLNIS